MFHSSPEWDFTISPRKKCGHKLVAIMQIEFQILTKYIPFGAKNPEGVSLAVQMSRIKH